MTFLDEWRSQISDSVSQFAKLSASAGDVDLRYGLLAAALLWPIRRQVQEFDQQAIEAVRHILGEDAKHVLRVIQSWGDNRVVVARGLAAQAKTDDELRKALVALISFFGVTDTFVDALTPVIAAQSGAGDVYNIDGRILRSALLTNIGGTQTIQDLTIQVLDTPKRDYTIVSSPEDERERQEQITLLNRVKTFRIKSVLEKSVHHEVLVELGKEMRPSLVEHPWDVTIISSEQPDQPVPLGKRMIEIFDEMGQTLLILGEPGSGKTITLLELARDLIARAEMNRSHPIPVVFDLASWAGAKQSLADWLVQELFLKYNVTNATAQKWVKNNTILPLLDGLDEVYETYRDSCAAAINQFRQEHGLLGIVVSSRIEDYKMLKTRLKFEGAVMIQPLTDEQVKHYLAGFGSRLVSLSQAIDNDENLRELSRVPLMLAVMCLAYDGMPVESVIRGQLDSIEARRQHLFDTYIRRMFGRVERRKRNRYSYSDSEVIHWLSELARNTRWGLPVFLTDRIQPQWLPERTRGLYTVCLGLAIGALGGLLANIPPGNPYFAGVMVASTISSAPFALLAGLSLILATSSLSAVQQGIIGFGIGLIFRVLNERNGWGTGVSLNYIYLANRISWSGDHIFQRWRYYAVVGLGFGLLLTWGGSSPWIMGALGYTGSTNIILNAFVYTACYLLFVLLLNGIRQTRLDIIPVRLGQAARNSIVVGLFASLILAVFYLVILGPVNLLSSAIIFGVFVGLWYGGLAVIQHYLLRMMLSYAKCLPWDINRFLEYCADRVFLRQVGRGYAFIHRLLLEHFAELDQVRR
jgi:hypothetical protein